MLLRPTLRRRIALTGLYNSGKTVFLTSLLDQLHNDADDFRVGENRSGRITAFKTLPTPRNLESFPYEQCRRCIVEDHVFPKKSFIPSSVHFRLRRSDHRWVDYLVQLLDFPGERFADVSMVGRNYVAWSDAILGEWQHAKGGFLEEYQVTCEADAATADQLVISFKQFLAKRVLACQPHICPSTFMLGLDGRKLSGRTVYDLLARGTITGSAPNLEFAPLSSIARQRHPSVVQQFTEHYSEYRRKLVEPLFTELAWCDRLVVLIDVPFLLECGPTATNDNYDLLEAIVRTIAPSDNALVKLAKLATNPLLPATWRFGGVEKIAFVAAKSDLVARRDRDNLVSLVKQMVQRSVRQLDGVQVEYFAASAVVSTREAPASEGNGSPRLIGRLKLDRSKSPPELLSPKSEPRSFAISQLPEQWPVHWEPLSFRFEEVHPDVPRVKFSSPKHSDLDKVFEFVLS